MEITELKQVLEKIDSMSLEWKCTPGKDGYGIPKGFYEVEAKNNDYKVRLRGSDWQPSTSILVSERNKGKERVLVDEFFLKKRENECHELVYAYLRRLVERWRAVAEPAKKAEAKANLDRFLNS